MNRDYIDGKHNDIVFFLGKEVEHTPAYNLNTLFVVGVHKPDVICQIAKDNNCEHIFCGANHSFNPKLDILINCKDLYDTVEPWDLMITSLIEKGFMVSLDFDSTDLSVVLEMNCNTMHNFIPQISVKLPYIQLLNYNAMLKIDDTNFETSNPGVWCHRVHDLMDIDKFTSWREYKKDKPI